MAGRVGCILKYGGHLFQQVTSEERPGAGEGPRGRMSEQHQCKALKGRNMPRNSKEASVRSCRAKPGKFINTTKRINFFILTLIKYNEDPEFSKVGITGDLEESSFVGLWGWRKFQREWENWI